MFTLIASVHDCDVVQQAVRTIYHTVS